MPGLVTKSIHRTQTLKEDFFHWKTSQLLALRVTLEVLHWMCDSSGCEIIWARGTLVSKGVSFLAKSFTRWIGCINPFTPKSDQCQISPAASPEILHHTVWRTWHFIAYLDARWLYYQFSLPHLYVSLRSERVNYRELQKRLTKSITHILKLCTYWMDLPP